MYKIAHYLSKLLVKLLYRIDANGIEGIPETGAAVIAPNHVSYIDALLILAISKRPAKFVMWYKIYENKYLNWFFKRAGIIPIASPRESMHYFKSAFEKIEGALSNGELVVFFPEGGITHDGELQEIKGGIEYVIKKTPVPVIPVGLSGVYGSYFSRSKKKPLLGKWLRKLKIKIGDPIAPDKLSKECVYRSLKSLTESKVQYNP
ncbi:1-acyl-sn-glycerol-3-phosphate acyltransferase [Photobacterium galatheae]|nr:1-acyl-sn-glycerol-3-phosphate acyltransferase [Photobacterium galatheae]MCM0149007.1 1-acyl-sn-glycerol-3-phosphate acyltransferase [Photobacterium galatheae]